MAALSNNLDSSFGPAVCRVCLCGETSIPYFGNTAGEPLISPCHCKGTVGLYHRSCLEHWLSTSHTRSCEICKFRYEIGRRKQGFISYLRANSWLMSGDHPRSIGSDCACLLLLTPLTLGGSVLCIQNISDRLRLVDRNGDLEKLHEILGLGFMACFLMVVFVFWILFTALYYFHDFRVWQKKNVILFVVDQSESESFSRSSNRCESQRPLMLRKKLRDFLLRCCGGSSSRNDVISLRDTVIDMSPQMMQTVGSTDYHLNSIQMHQLRYISPISHSPPTPEATSSTVGTPMIGMRIDSNDRSSSPNFAIDRFSLDPSPSMSTFGHDILSVEGATTSTSFNGLFTPMYNIEHSVYRCCGAISGQEPTCHIRPDVDSRQSGEPTEDTE